MDTIAPRVKSFILFFVFFLSILTFSALVASAAPQGHQNTYQRYYDPYQKQWYIVKQKAQTGHRSFFRPKKQRRYTTRRTARYTRHQVARSAPPQRQLVPYNGKYAAGTIIIDTSERRLYHVRPGRQAMRYAVGVGRPGFQWSGDKRVSRKAEWPSWSPPAQMRAREARKGRHLPTHMPGGINNPLGARALYLGGTLFRIHGSNEPWTIGHAVSSGCFRMTNDDVTHLYNNVSVGTRVVVRH